MDSPVVVLLVAATMPSSGSRPSRLLTLSSTWSAATVVGAGAAVLAGAAAEAASAAGSAQPLSPKMGTACTQASSFSTRLGIKVSRNAPELHE